MNVTINDKTALGTVGLTADDVRRTVDFFGERATVALYDLLASVLMDHGETVKALSLAYVADSIGIYLAAQTPLTVCDLSGRPWKPPKK